MATNVASTPVIGANLDASGIENVVTTTPPSAQPRFKLGTQVLGADGKLYVYAKAGGAIAANTAVCTVNPTTFVITASGGTYLSPTVALVANDCCWMAKALA